MAATTANASNAHCQRQMSHVASDGALGGHPTMSTLMHESSSKDYDTSAAEVMQTLAGPASDPDALITGSSNDNDAEVNIQDNNSLILVHAASKDEDAGALTWGVSDLHSAGSGGSQQQLHRQRSLQQQLRAQKTSSSSEALGHGSSGVTNAAGGAGGASGAAQQRGSAGRTWSSGVGAGSLKLAGPHGGAPAFDGAASRLALKMAQAAGSMGGTGRASMDAQGSFHAQPHGGQQQLHHQGSHISSQPNITSPSPAMVMPSASDLQGHLARHHETVTVLFGRYLLFHALN